jgi:hypothetical protein
VVRREWARKGRGREGGRERCVEGECGAGLRRDEGYYGEDEVRKPGKSEEEKRDPDLSAS